MAVMIDVTSMLATVCTIALFMSSIPTCLKIIRSGNTLDVNFFPFIAMFCNASLWMKYGTLKGDTTLVLVNSVGVALNLAYMCIYYKYASHKLVVFQQVMLGAVVLFPVLIYVQYYTLELQAGVAVLGLFCCIVGVVAYGAPLTAMVHVIRSQSTETMAFPLSCANFIVSSEWTLYGYLVSDFNIVVPNGLGMLLGCLQLLLFARYRSTSRSASTGASSIEVL